jgi:cell division protein ZapA (FtsZ GTPase activity inhibitor)
VKVATAVRRELRALRERDPAASDSAAAAMALVLARELDAPDHVECPHCGERVTVEGNSGTQKAQIARALGQVMERLRGRTPARGTSRVDELRQRRERHEAAGRPAP